MADDLVRPYREFVFAPDGLGRVEVSRGPVQRRKEPTRFSQRLLRTRRLRPRPDGDEVGLGFIWVDVVAPGLAWDEPQDLAPLVVDPENVRS